ncbi:MAG: Tat pathway signal protein [Cyanobacteria bacterium SZAS LIN-5]|nr:Tat pathway signal protein [Cyanobacteria bacterium SZAS LIN-5]
MTKFASAKRKSHRVRDEAVLERVQRATFQWFVDCQNHDTGLIWDRSRPGCPATIAGVGFALTVYPVAVRRGWINRDNAVAYAVKVLRVLANAPQGEGKSGYSGHRGFFYHFLDPATGLRATAPQFWDSELSTIDTALLMAGVSFARTYFSKRNGLEKEIRSLCTALLERVEWSWMIRADKKIHHGWTPENGIIPHVYGGYSEALLLYLQALAPKNRPAPAECWTSLLDGVKAERFGGKPYIAMPGTPLFCYQYPHCWIDFRGIADDTNRRLGFDYFQNSVRATKAQHRYSVDNPNGWRGYDELDWGLTACDGPGNETRVVDNRERTFRGYSERGCPRGFDDGTLAPTAAISSIVYTPRRSLRTMRFWLKHRPEIFSEMTGFADAFNPTFDTTRPSGWVGSDRVAIDQGPIILMIENYRSGFVWEVMRKDRSLRRALRRAGFKGGWLEE